jgi:hypothetical protein
MPMTGRYFDVKWFKRYAISCLIATFVFAAVDGHARPGKHPREGAIIVAAVGWPIVTAIVVGSTIGEIVSETNQGK